MADEGNAFMFMATDQALAFLLFAIVAAITPGPSNIILAATGAHAGVLRGLPCLLGVVAGMGLMVFMVAFGLGSLVLASPIILNGLKWCGIALLLWLAGKIATSGGGAATTTMNVLGFWQAAAFQWVNPKSWLVSASAVGAYMHASGASAFGQASALGALFVIAALPSCFVWLVFGAAFQQFLRTERARSRFNVTMGLLLAASVVLFIVE